jgi:hypothetical protein
VVTLRGRTDDLDRIVPRLAVATGGPKVTAMMQRAFERVLNDRRDVRSFGMHSPHEGGVRIVWEQHKAHDESQRHDSGPD